MSDVEKRKEGIQKELKALWKRRQKFQKEKERIAGKIRRLIKEDRKARKEYSYSRRREFTIRFI